MGKQTDKPSGNTEASFLRFTYRFTFAAAIPAGTLFGLTLLLLRWNGLLDGTDYTYARILLQTAYIGFLFPALLCSMFWVLSREGSTKWCERLGFVVLFVLFPSLLIAALIRFFIHY